MGSGYSCDTFGLMKGSLMKESYILFGLFLLVASSVYGADQSGNFTGEHKFPFDNITLLIVNCGGQNCTYDFTKKRGDGPEAPYGVLDLKMGDKTYTVTDHHVGNNHLMVNNTVYELKAFKEHLLIDQDGTIKPEAGEIHPNDQFLLDTCPSCRKLVK